MKFQLFTAACALSSMATGVFAAPSPAVDAVAFHQPKLSAAVALQYVHALNKVLDTHSAKINHTTSKIHKKSTAAEKKAAVHDVGAQMTAMATAINQAVGEIGARARGVSTKDARDEMEIEERASGASVQALANALKHTLITAAGTVNTALAVLGLTPLLAFLTPLTGSLSGLVLTLKAVVDALLPILNVILDGVVLGLTGLLAGLIL